MRFEFLQAARMFSSAIMPSISKLIYPESHRPRFLT